jgi:predicted DNA-binding transcriptional regulator AlpA
MTKNALDLLTMEEVAQLLQCSKAHISNITAGRVSDCLPIPVVRLGRRNLVLTCGSTFLY